MGSDDELFTLKDQLHWSILHTRQFKVAATAQLEES